MNGDLASASVTVHRLSFVVDHPLQVSRPATPRSTALRIHVVSHTHWDREWYQPLGRFRQRLVALVDELIADPPAEGTSFLLDGQAIVVEDYLAVRPDQRAELSALLRDGRLEAGPWYVLADELIPSGEAMVRNLLAGRRTVRALRSEAPRVLYCPDSFGHPAMLPLLAAGFGLPAVIAWRGYGGGRWPDGDAAWWHAPDGSRALLLHLPPDGYEFGSNLPADGAEATNRWRRIERTLVPRAQLGVVLLQNGADHHARQPDHDAAIAALAAAAQPHAVLASSLRAYVEDALHAAGETQLPPVSGELRDSYGYTWTLQGTFGTRAAQKRTNALCERLLVRDAEPWAALARATRRASHRAVLDAAWRALLECHPHDTLCGCSIDEVAAAAEVRWADAAAQGAGVRSDAMHALIDHDPAAAHGRTRAWSPVLVVRNRAARPRMGVARVRIETFIADVGVGPGSAGQHLEIPREPPPLALDAPHQVLAEHIANVRMESPRHYPDNDLVVVRDVVMRVPEVPGYAIRCIPAGDVPPPSTEPATALVDAVTDAVQVRGTTLSYGVTVFDTASVIGIECARDIGDLYTPAIREPGRPPVAAAPKVTHAGPLHGAVSTSWSIAPAGGGEVSTVEVTTSLTAGEPFLRLDVQGVHHGTDQRIRLLVRTGVAGPDVWADAAFGAVRRIPIEPDVSNPPAPARDALAPDTGSMNAGSARALVETAPPTAPLHRYISLFAGARGATVYSDGLAEYEALPDGTVAITLVRAVGELSRHDLPERPGHAGWPAPTPGAQCPGPFSASFALYLHGGLRDAATIDDIERTADDVLLPLVGESLRSAVGVQPETPGVQLDGAGLAFSAMKESEDGKALVLRCVNLLDDAVDGSWTLGIPVASAHLARLDETPVHSLEVDASRCIRFTAAPRAVVTILVG